MQEIVQDIAVRIVARRGGPNRGHPIRRRGVGRGKRAVPSLVNVSKGVEAERLRPDRSAVRAGKAHQIIVSVIAGLRISAVEWIRYGQTSQCADWIPVKLPDGCLRAYVVLIFLHPPGWVVGERIGRAAQAHFFLST